MKTLFCALILFLACQSSWAGATVTSQNGEVRVGNTLILRISPPDAGNRVVNRITQILQRSINPSQIHITRFGNDYWLQAGSRPVVLVTTDLAKRNKTSPRALALLWANRLTEAMTHGTYLLTPAQLVIPLGESRSLPVTGRYPGELTVDIQNPTISNMIEDEPPLMFKGLQSGTTQVKVSVGNLDVYTEVVVKKWAALIPTSATLVVTGKTVSQFFLKHALSRFIDNQILQQPGTGLSIQMPENSLPSTLAAGQTLDIPIKASASGGNYLPVSKSLTVQIENQPFALTPPAYLIVSNNPENFTTPGTLFQKDFPANAPVRIFFHHHNNSDSLYRMAVDLENPSREPVFVHVLSGVAGPDRHELYVGEAAATQFFSAVQNTLGTIIEIRAGGSYTLTAQQVPPLESFSGILLLTPVKSSPNQKLFLKVHVKLAEEEAQVPEDSQGNQDEKGKPRGIFPDPEIAINAAYTVGEDYAFISIGKGHILIDPKTGKPDFGNYGVLYTVTVTFSNSSTVEKTAHLMFVPQAGPATGIFLLNQDDLVRVPVVQPFAAYPLVRLSLDPGETKTITLQTIPAGGSYYPVNLVAEP